MRKLSKKLQRRYRVRYRQIYPLVRALVRQIESMPKETIMDEEKRRRTAREGMFLIGEELRRRRAYKGIVVFWCKTPEERQRVFHEIDRVLDSMPNIRHMFEEV